MWKQVHQFEDNKSSWVKKAQGDWLALLSHRLTFDTELFYTFVSDFHKEDIEYTLNEIIPEDLEPKLVSVVRFGGLQSADQLCKLFMKIPPDKNFTWPIMSSSQLEVIKDLQTVPHFDPAWYGGGVPPHYDTIINSISAAVNMFIFNTYFNHVLMS